MGDSITQRGMEPQGWLNLIGNKYVREFDFVNRGFSGYTSRWILEKFSIIQDDFKDAFITFILLGANDACTESPQNVPLKDFERNLQEIIDRISEVGCGRIILIETPWVDGPAWLNFSNANNQGNQSVPNRNEVDAASYAKAVFNVAKLNEIQSISLYQKMKHDTDPQRLLSDGLHFADAGNALLAKLVDEVLAQTSESKESQLPDWKDLS